MTARAESTSPALGPLKWVELLVIGVFCLLTIGSLLAGPNLNPDSTSYITAASNIVRTGRLFIFANTPSRSMSPRIEPYTEQPPGFPLYLAPFVLVFRDPVVSALIAQSLAIAFFYIAVYLMSAQIRLHVVLRIQALLVIGALNSLRQLHSTIGSETLFISLSLAAGILALGILLGDRKRFGWPILVGSLALASSIRFVGVANAVWVLPMLFRRETIREVNWLLQKQRVSWGLLLAGISLIALSTFADVLIYSRELDIGARQLIGIALGAGLLLTGIVGIWLRRLNKKQIGLDRADLATHDELWSIAAVGAAIAPFLLWLIRNKLIYGHYAFWHRIFKVPNTNILFAPVEFLSNELLEIRIGHSYIILVAIAVLWIVPFFIGTSQERKVHILIIGATAAFVAVVWIPSLFARIDVVGARLLSPAVVLGLLVTLHAIQVAFNSWSPLLWRYGLLLLPMLFLVLGKNIKLVDFSLSEIGLNHPAERQLWNEIRELEQFKESTHFYSDPIFEHQIYAGIPQRIIWDHDLIRDPEVLSDLLSRGKQPFILLSFNSPEAIQLAEILAVVPLELSRIEFPNSKYVLYYEE